MLVSTEVAWQIQEWKVRDEKILACSKEIVSWAVREKLVVKIEAVLKEISERKKKVDSCYCNRTVYKSI